MHSSTDRWQAVLNRDSRADFFYAVSTTGIYCRPACPSRRARPENVTFYATEAEAEAAGFRPCKRCLSPPGHEVELACRLLEQGPVDLLTLAAQVGLSPSHLQRRFKAATGLTPRAYARDQQDRRFRRELGCSTVTEAITAAGFGSTSRAYEAEALGMTPSQYRKGGRGLKIQYALGVCSLGQVLVAATPRGLCTISLGEEPDLLVADLHRRFPQAEIYPGAAEFADVVARVVDFVDEPGLGLDLPLDIQGTAFQRRVWLALREIPRGQTCSYSELAERVGQPTATRAVAGACAGNHLAVVIPCHRVVGRDGTLTGYRWGVDRKARLLERERRPE